MADESKSKKGGGEKKKASAQPSPYVALKVTSTDEAGNPKTLEVLDGTFESANGAATARKKAFDAQPEADQDAGLNLVAIPSRSFVAKKRKSKITRSSAEEE